MTRGMENVKVCTVDDLGKTAELTENPVVTCARCGMKAHSAANVCVPKYDTDITG